MLSSSLAKYLLNSAQKAFKVSYFILPRVLLLSQGSGSQWLLQPRWPEEAAFHWQPGGRKVAHITRTEMLMCKKPSEADTNSLMHHTCYDQWFGSVFNCLTLLVRNGKSICNNSQRVDVKYPVKKWRKVKQDHKQINLTFFAEVRIIAYSVVDQVLVTYYTSLKFCSDTLCHTAWILKANEYLALYFMNLLFMSL